MKSGRIGDVRRSGRGFSAEVRGLTEALQRPSGRLFQYSCDADLGDRRCGVDLGQSQYTAQGAISGISGPTDIQICGLPALDDGWLSRGVLEIIGGTAAGTRIEIRSHRHGEAGADVSLWQSLPPGVQSGDGVRVTAGCDKRPVTCAAKFANIKNFRGFPHIPGNAYVMSVARPGMTVRGSASR